MESGGTAQTTDAREAGFTRGHPPACFRSTMRCVVRRHLLFSASTTSATTLSSSTTLTLHHHLQHHRSSRPTRIETRQTHLGRRDAASVVDAVAPNWLGRREPRPTPSVVSSAPQPTSPVIFPPFSAQRLFHYFLHATCTRSCLGKLSRSSSYPLDDIWAPHITPEEGDRTAPHHQRAGVPNLFFGLPVSLASYDGCL